MWVSADPTFRTSSSEMGNSFRLAGHIGNKYAGGDLTIEEIEEHLDKGNFKDLLEIANQFGEQVTAYFTPNENSQPQ